MEYDFIVILSDINRWKITLLMKKEWSGGHAFNL